MWFWVRDHFHNYHSSVTLLKYIFTSKVFHMNIPPDMNFTLLLDTGQRGEMAALHSVSEFSIHEFSRSFLKRRTVSKSIGYLVSSVLKRLTLWIFHMWLKSFCCFLRVYLANFSVMIVEQSESWHFSEFRHISIFISNTIQTFTHYSKVTSNLLL